MRCVTKSHKLALCVSYSSHCHGRSNLPWDRLPLLVMVLEYNCKVNKIIRKTNPKEIERTIKHKTNRFSFIASVQEINGTCDRPVNLAAILLQQKTVKWAAILLQQKTVKLAAKVKTVKLAAILLQQKTVKLTVILLQQKRSSWQQFCCWHKYSC